MSEVVRVNIHKTLDEVLRDLGRNVALDFKKRYSLSEVIVPRTLSSQIAAAKLKGMKNVPMRFRRISKDKGVLEFF